MSHEWNCRCPRCERELDLPRDEPDRDDVERERHTVVFVNPDGSTVTTYIELTP